MCSNILKQIFFDKHQHWDAFVEKHKEHIRPNVIKEVQKFRGCGGAMYPEYYKGVRGYEYKITDIRRT